MDDDIPELPPGMEMAAKIEIGDDPHRDAVRMAAEFYRMMMDVVGESGCCPHCAASAMMQIAACDLAGNGKVEEDKIREWVENALANKDVLAVTHYDVGHG